MTNQWDKNQAQRSDSGKRYDVTLAVASGDSDCAATRALPIERLGHFRLLDRIGRGGMGDVYRAHDEAVDRIVAIKVLPADLAGDPHFVERFRREAQALAKLSHPHIVPVYTIDEDQGHVYFAMQFIDGESLDRRLRRVGKLPLATALDILVPCLEALQAAHDQQLIHRDIKPGNVLIQKDTQRVFLVDFGLVRQVSGGDNFTASGMVMGTVDYMSPEQARGAKGIDHRADLYSIGAMFYHMLSGRLQFEEQSFQGMLYCHAYEEPYPLELAAPGLPAKLVEIVKRLLAKRPEDRPTDCRAVLAVLKPLRDPEFLAKHVASEIEAAKHDVHLQSYARLLRPANSFPQRMSDRALALWGNDSAGRQESLASWEEELDNALADVQQRLRRLETLRATGEQLQSVATGAAAKTPESGEVGADSGADSLAQRLVEVELELARADELYLALAHNRQALAERRLYVEQHAGHSTIKSVSALLILAVALITAGIAGRFTFIALSTPPAVIPSPPPPATPAVMAAPQVGAWNDLLANCDPAKDTIIGLCERTPDGIHFLPGQRNLVALPQRMPAQYDLEAEFTKLGGRDGIDFVLPIGDRACNVCVAGWNNRQHGVYHVDTTADSQMVPGFVEDNKRYHVGIRVRQQGTTASIELRLDGQPIVSWEGERSRLVLNPAFERARLGCVNVTTFFSDTLLHQARWRAVGGSEAPLETFAIDSAQRGAKPAPAPQVTAPSDVELLTGPVERLNERILASPGDAAGYELRALWFGARHQWAEARKDWETTVYLRPNDFVRLELLLKVCLLLDDKAGYREWSKHARRQLALLPDRSYRVPLLSDLLLDEEPPEDLEAIAAKFSELRDLDPSNDNLGRAYPYLLYRQGRYDDCLEATKIFDASPLWYAGSAMFRPMSQHRLGQTTAAKAELQNMKNLVESQTLASFENYPWSAHWRQRILSFVYHQMTVQVLYREATRTILGTEESLNLAPIDFVEHADLFDSQAKSSPIQTPPVSLGQASAIDPSSKIAGPLAALDAELQAHPQDAKLYELRGYWYAARHRWPEACADFERGLAIKPDSWWSRTKLAKIYLYLGNSEAYQQHCQILIKQQLNQSDQRTMELLRPLCLEAERWKSQLDGLEAATDRLIAKEPNNLEMLRTAAEIYYAQQRWQDCIDAAEKLLPKGPDHVIDGYPWLFRLMAMHQLGRVAAAKQELQAFKTLMEAQRLDTPKNPDYDRFPVDDRLRWYIFNALEAQIVYRQASELILGKREELNIASAVATSYLEGPLEPLTAAVEQSPLDANAWIRRSYWHVVRQNWKEAQADLEQYLQIKPADMTVRRQHAEVCLALEDEDLRPYYVINEFVQRLPPGRWALDDLRTLCLITRPEGLEANDLKAWAARSKPATGWKEMYLVPVNYRSGDWQACVAASSELFPRGPELLFHALPCLMEAAALKQLGKDTDARRKLLVVRDFVEQGKSRVYSGKARDEAILNLAFDSLHAQIFYREASELIGGAREELKAPSVLEIVNGGPEQ